MSPTGNRIALPAAGANVCASCAADRRNVRRGWAPITRDGAVVGHTCPACPRVDEPIRRITTKAGAVRFRAVVDASAPGERRRQVTSTHVTLDDARARVEEIRAAVAAAGSYAPPAPESVEALATRWLASRVDVRAGTVDSYRTWLKPVLRHLGTRNVRTLTHADVQGCVSWLSQYGGAPTRAHPDGRPLMPRSVRSSMVALQQVLDLAVIEGTLPRNPARDRGIRRPREARTVGHDLEHWQPSELAAFRAHADADPLAAAWRLTLSGLTRADVLGLRWADVDLDAGTVTVSQGRTRAGGGEGSRVDEPKSVQRSRTVPVEVAHPGTVTLLRSLRARQAADKLRAGEVYTDSGFVVVNEVGEPVAPLTYSSRFARLCRSAGVPVIRLHSVRHSLAFWLHSLGVTPADAAALLGHTVEVHLRVYLPSSRNAGIASAAAAIGRAAVAAE